MINRSTLELGAELCKSSSARTSFYKSCNFALLAGMATTLLLNPSVARADDSTAGSVAANGSAAAPTAPANAGVQLIELNLNVLRDLGLDIKNILKAASSLYDEVTIQPVTIQTQPEVVGYGTIINIPVGFTPTGAGPQPTKKRIDMAMNQMRPIIQLLKQDVDDFESGRSKLDVSASQKAELQPLFDEWVSQVNDISNNLTTLENLTKTQPFDDNNIASAASAIHKDSKQMEELRRKLYKWLQKEGKKKSRNA